ncbi:MAG: amino acid transporter [Firmicutes bacterium]|nr:amino acid transporter [Bacillota bacterium]
METGLDQWERVTPSAARELLHGFSASWWIAGGWAIELHLGRCVRDHGDMDILLQRRDQVGIQAYLAGWDLYVADPPGSLRFWLPGEYLHRPIQDIWCRPKPESRWHIQIMLIDVEDGDWVFKRDPRIRRQLSEIGLETSEEILYLRPEIQLLYKAKSPRPKDEIDFTAVLPMLTNDERSWLRSALSLAHGEHRWVAKL